MLPPMTLSVQVKGHGDFLGCFTSQRALEASGWGSEDMVALDRKIDKAGGKKVTTCCALIIIYTHP